MVLGSDMSSVVSLINPGFHRVYEKPYLSHSVDQGEARVVLTTREQFVIDNGSRFSLEMGTIIVFICRPSNTIVFFVRFHKETLTMI